MTDKNNTISKLEDLLREIEKQDYVKIKYEDLTETLEEAINLIQTLQKEKERLGSLYYYVNEAWYKNRDLIQKQQAELEKKDKTIDVMAEELVSQFNHYEPCWIYYDIDCNKYEKCKDCVKKYIEKKVEENE